MPLPLCNTPPNALQHRAHLAHRAHLQHPLHLAHEAQANLELLLAQAQGVATCRSMHCLAPQNFLHTSMGPLESAAPMRFAPLSAPLAMQEEYAELLQCTH